MPTKTLKTIAANVRRLRAAKKLSQEAVAEAAGLTQPRISEIETLAVDGITDSTMEALASALGVSVSKLTKTPKPKR